MNEEALAQCGLSRHKQTTHETNLGSAGTLPEVNEHSLEIANDVLEVCRLFSVSDANKP